MFSARVRLKKAVADVALVSPDRALHERLRAAFKADQRYDFCAIDGTLADLAADFDPATGPSVLIADLHQDRATSIAAIQAMRRERFDGAIVALSDDLDEDELRGLLHWRISDWLRSDTATHDIVAACERALLAEVRNEKPGRSLCLAMVPAAGGVGTTTLAIETAFLLARRGRGYRSTCLIDLNFQSGVLADYLDLKPGFRLETVAAAPDRLDAHMLEVMISRHESGLAVLAAPRVPGDCIDPDPALIARVLGVAAELFETMVVDLPSAWQPWTNDVLAGCDRILVVTEFTVPALRKAQELSTALDERLSGVEVATIVNKVRQPLFGSGLKRRDVKEMLGAGLAGFVPEDCGLVREAINRGKPLGAVRRSNRIVRSLAGIVL